MPQLRLIMWSLAVMLYWLVGVNSGKLEFLNGLSKVLLDVLLAQCSVQHSLNLHTRLTAADLEPSKQGLPGCKGAVSPCPEAHIIKCQRMLCIALETCVSSSGSSVLLEAYSEQLSGR